jgi:enoyl-CoA hydratase
MTRAEALARQVVGNAPLTLRATKDALRRLRDEDLIRLCYTSEDYREGMEVFLGKRAPVWKGAVRGLGS